MPLIDSTQDWDKFVHTIPKAHILQTSAWGTFKSNFGWTSSHARQGDCGAQVLFRSLPIGYTIAYIPKGPLGKGWQDLWPQVDALCRQKQAILLIVEPDMWEPLPEEVMHLWLADFSPDPNTIQPRRTLLVDLKPDEESILAGMKSKTRYNIHLAERKDVIVKETQDLQAFYKMMHITGRRDGFALHDIRYYQQVYAQFAPLGQCVLLEATWQGKPLAALMAFVFQKQAWYFYGASSDEERNRMPTYLLQWEAMRWAKARGCTSYDLWGVPDADEQTLEGNFTNRSDDLWGVYRFKRGFGGELKRSAPAFVRAYRPVLYRLYKWYTRRQPVQA